MGKGRIKIDIESVVHSPGAVINNELITWDICSNCGEQTDVHPCPKQCGLAVYCSSLCLVHHKQSHQRVCSNILSVKTPPPIELNDEFEDSNNDEIPLLDEDNECRLPLPVMSSEGYSPQQVFFKKKLSNLKLLPAKFKKMLPSEETICPNQEIEIVKDKPFTPQKSYIIQSPRVEVSLEPWSRFNIDFNQFKFLVHQSGPAGFQLQSDGDRLVVCSITSPWVWMQGIRPGDSLERIGGIATFDLAPDSAFCCLYRADLPTVLRFRSKKRVDRTTIEVLYPIDGRLGVTFAGDGPQDIPIVNRLLPQMRLEKYSNEMTSLECGDILVAVNTDYDSIQHGLTKSLRHIAESPKPLVLYFQRLVVDDEIMPPPQPEVAEDSEDEERISAAATPNIISLNATTLTAGRGEVCIIWRASNLGLSFVECTTTGLMQVHRLTGKGETPLVDQVRPGYLLTSISGIAVEPFQLSRNCELLSSSSKPCLLLFKPPKTRVSRPLTLFEGRASNRVSSRTFVRQLCQPSEHEYEVIWSASPLGLTFGFIRIHSIKTPFIKRIKATCRLQLRSDPTTHRLIAVNNITTSGLSSTELARLLKCARFPIVLRFRNSKGDDEANNLSLPPSNRISGSDSDDSYTPSTSYALVWRDGSLGLTFEPCDAAIAAVKRISPQGVASQMNNVAIGDVLVHINGQVIPKNQSFKVTMALLVGMPKPVTLGLMRATPEFRDSNICESF
ncbi:hypothetical protein THRCLA_05142 [Thraustotheca clavata]|uniref:PDZ domain-containing protein n=1 Tax=Thraustotheca clavata TaxID=74557 RepID=A0A1V9ZWW9_9STRA|nr:hypothetical protein THRCLA_05142 [Thraustotheca clavata]